jgi:predicted hydrocarbon binding protein
MKNQTAPTYYYPNKMGRLVLLAMEEIIGRTGVNAILNLSGLSGFINNYPPNNLDLQFSFNNLSEILQRLEDLYGARGGQGLALRSGRACLKYGLREFGPLLGINDLAFRLLPLQMKVRVGAEAFALSFNELTDQVVRLVEEIDRFYWIIERCPLCWNRTAEQPVCHLAVGILEESLHWVSGGRHFNVEEIQCIAAGAPTCTIAIDKEPLN